MEPMEPIPEEDDFASPTTSYSCLMTQQQQQQQKQHLHQNNENFRNFDYRNNKRIIESKQRLKEIYKTEEVDTLVSTLPKESVPDEWNRFSSEEVIVDPNMAHTYITGLAGGQPSARGTKYSYIYESHIDEPQSSTIQYTTTEFGPTDSQQQQINNNDDIILNNGQDLSDEINNLERFSKSTQKVTRLTKITTTRSIKQIPVNPDDIFFDVDGNPILNEYDAQQISEYDGDEGIGIDLSRTYISEHEEYSSPASSSTTVAVTTSANPPPPPLANQNVDNNNIIMNCETPIYDDSQYYKSVPGSPGVPEVIDLSDSNISLAWLRPERDGTAGEILGYRVQFRRTELENWEPAHDDLLGETECKITNLDPNDSYYFRVLAANPAGFGIPSISSPAIRLRHNSDSTFCYTSSNVYNNGISGGYSMNSHLPPPQRPRVVEIDGDRALIEWNYLPEDENNFRKNGDPLIIGYIVEYRSVGNISWISANDHPILKNQYQVQNLRPNGEYEFRVLGKDSDGCWTRPSLSTGIVRIRPAVPHRTTQENLLNNDNSPNYDVEFNSCLTSPGQPQIIESGSNWVHLGWSKGSSIDPNDQSSGIGYLIESRQLFDLQWNIQNPILNDGGDFSFPAENQFIVKNLHSETSYEFRVSTVSLKNGSRSAPSSPSEIIRLRSIEGVILPTNISTTTTTTSDKSPPQRPQPPEYLDFDQADCSSLTLCWLPAQSTLPVLGYEVEFRDLMQDATRWYKLTDQLVRTCKTTVGYLIHGHQYQFRILAKNCAGFSPPSDPSPLITIGGSTRLKDTKYVEAERHASVSLLDEEMKRESPPLPDRDDSPPPIYRQKALHWRDPTLKEVIDYLKSPDQCVVQDASGYLQHLTYNNDTMKEETRNYGGIQNLIDLLKSDNAEILRNACGCLKNLAFGKENDLNKLKINEAGGVKALAMVLQRTNNPYVKEEATGAIWNISSYDDLKEPVLHQVTQNVINEVVIPFSGFSTTTKTNENEVENFAKNSNVFRNGTGILRNISAANANARKILRSAPNLIDALLYFLGGAIKTNQIDTRSVENCICLLRNLSYRVQEVVDLKYDPNNRQYRSISNPALQSTRSKSAPSGSPKNKSKKLFKKSKKDGENNSPIYMFPNNGKSMGASRLWHPETVRLYLRMLQESADTEILEASAAAIQNLAACQFDGSILVRQTVRMEKGLPILVELLRLKEDKVVCAVCMALRNLALDQRNLELIGKYAMKELISKLPEPAISTPPNGTISPTVNTQRNPQISDATIGAVLGILWEAVRYSIELTQNIHETLRGTERLQTLAKSYPTYGKRVCKYATQVLYMMWQHKELHELFKRNNLKDSDFYSGTLVRSARKTRSTGALNNHEAATLARPISSQGAERPARFKTPLLDESSADVEQQRQHIGCGGNYNNNNNNNKNNNTTPTSTPNSATRNYGDYAESSPLSASALQLNGHHHSQLLPTTKKTQFSSSEYNIPTATMSHREPLYASVQKRNGCGSVAGDSWV